MSETISAHELAQKMADSPQDIFLLDIREQKEYNIANIGGVHIPMNEVPQRLKEIDFTKEVVVMCHRGIRSGMLVNYLAEQGYKATNLEGGIEAWSEKIDTTLSRY